MSAISNHYPVHFFPQIVMRVGMGLAVATLPLAAAGEPAFSDVFTAGKDGYESIRIPSVIVTPKGSVLAFAEGRQEDTDQAQNDIVMKRSTDGGATWSALKLIHDDGAHSLNNPTALIAGDGRVLLLYQRIPGHLKEASAATETGYDGDNIYRNLLVVSADDGMTWSPPVDVTRATKRATGATTICSGPGIGIRLTRGAHQGRLIFPFNEGPFWKWNNFAVFSDDDGKTWSCGENVPGNLLPDAKLGFRSQVNEVQMIETSDGGVRLVSRQFAGARVRKTAVSGDGGNTWSTLADLPELADPSCMGGVLRYSFDDGDGKGMLIHTSPGGNGRDHGKVHLSLDDGASWPVKRELWAGKFAYSVPTRLADGTVGCLFEADQTKRIVFARFGLSWLTQGPVLKNPESH